MTFKDSVDRNRVLFGPGTLKKNIPPGITLARDIPETYRKKYSEFSKDARYMRTLTHGNTIDKIYFNDIELVYTIRDENNRTQIVDSFTPDSTRPGLGTESTISHLEPGAAVLRTVLMSSLPPNTDSDVLKGNIHGLVGTDAAQIESVTVEKRSAFILCSSPVTASSIFKILATQKSGASTNNVYLAGRKADKPVTAAPISNLDSNNQT